jgi:hypothetical protein
MSYKEYCSRKQQHVQYSSSPQPQQPCFPRHRSGSNSETRDRNNSTVPGPLGGGLPGGPGGGTSQGGSSTEYNHRGGGANGGYPIMNGFGHSPSSRGASSSSASSASSATSGALLLNQGTPNGVKPQDANPGNRHQSPTLYPMSNHRGNHVEHCGNSANPRNHHHYGEGRH